MKTNKHQTIYTMLAEHFGPQHWWPGDSPFEVMVGAVLTQNTNWENVCKAITNLKNAHALNFPTLLALPMEDLAQLIKPSGYFNIKARRIKNLLQMIVEHYGDPDSFFAAKPTTGRKNLLAVKGIGPETADSILLYAANHPVFVVDAYTHRIFSRHGLTTEENDYHTIQQEFHDALPRDTATFNEYHALIVALGKKYCRKTNPRCEHCPLRGA